MVELSDYLNPKNILIAGIISSKVLLSGCGGEEIPIQVPEPVIEYGCDELKHDEFIPFGGTFIVRDVIDGELTDVLEVTVPQKHMSDIKMIRLTENLDNPITAYHMKGKLENEGFRMKYGPLRCFEASQLPENQNKLIPSVYQQLNPHLYGGKDGRMPLKPPAKLYL